MHTTTTTTIATDTKNNAIYHHIETTMFSIAFVDTANS